MAVITNIKIKNIDWVDENDMPINRYPAKRSVAEKNAATIKRSSTYTTARPTSTRISMSRCLIIAYPTIRLNIRI